MSMKYSKPLVFLISVCLLFFYKTIIFGHIPFPGDLLLTQYAPWRHQSYENYVAGAIPSKDQYFDVLRELYPWKSLVAIQWKQNEVPLWNPYNFSGAPLLANFQSQVYYPLGLIYFFLPQIVAWTIMVILQPILGSLFLYLFATQIGISTLGSIVAALLFNFSSFANVWIEFTTVWHTILWLPLLLYLVEKAVKQKHLRIRQQVLFIFGMCAAITAGHPQDFINSFLFLLLYCVFRLPRSLWINFGFILIIPFFICAPQIFPTLELFRNSARVAHDYAGIIHSMLIQLWQLPLIAVADFFGNPATKTHSIGDYVGKTLSIGITGFFLAITALFQKSKTWHVKFFFIIAVIILAITIHTPLTAFLYRYPWPILSTGTPTRILFIFVFALSLLAGFGFDAIKNQKKVPKNALLWTWILFGLLWFFTLTQYPAALRPMILSTVLLTGITGILFFSYYKKAALLLLIPFCIAELFYSFLKFNPFVPPSFVYPDNILLTKLKDLSGINRIWGYGTAGMEANFATQTQLYSTDGTDPLNLHWYNRFIQSSADGNIANTFTRTTRSDALLAPGYGETDLPNNTFRHRIMDVLSVTYIVDRSENPKNENTFPPDRFTEVWHHEDWTIYKNTKAAPKVYLSGDVRPYEDIKEFETQFFSDTFIPGKTILVEKKDTYSMPTFTDIPRQNTVDILSYTPNKVSLRVNTNASQFLFINDTYDAGWTVLVNGVDSRLYKANFAFRGTIVPKGTSDVEFIYKPRSFETGKVISIVAILFTGVFLLSEVKDKKFRRLPQ